MAFAAALTPAVPRGAARTSGYSYAGVASARAVGGVAATLELSGAARIRDGQVAAWVGVGGPGLGRGGVDEWIQGGLSQFAGASTGSVYYEVKRGIANTYATVSSGVEVGERYTIAVLEESSRPGWWRVWVDGSPASPFVFLPGSHGAWPAQVVAENWAKDPRSCNAFAFRFTNLAIRRPASPAAARLTAAQPFASGGIELERTGTGFSARRRCG